MPEKRKRFWHRLPRLHGASIPARAPAKQRSATGTPPVAAEPIPFEPITSSPLRPAGTAQVPSPRRKGSSPPRVAPEASLPSPPTPHPEVPSLVVSQPPDLKSELAMSVQEVAQPNAAEPQPTNGKPAKPVASASIPEPSIPPETPLLKPVPQPLLNPQQTATLLPLVTDLAESKNPSMPTSPEKKAMAPPSAENSLLSAVSRPSFESQPRETTLPENPVDSTSVPNTAAVNPQKLFSPAMKVSTTTPLESSKPQKYSRVEVIDKEEAPSESSSHEEIKFIPKKSMVPASSRRSDTTRLSGVGSYSSFQQEIKKDMLKLVHPITSGNANTMPMVDESVGVITLAGENTGATMQLTSESSKKKEHIHIRRKYRSDPDESVKGTTDAEEDDKEIGQGEGDKSANCTFLNSNVQGVNNSVALDSSVSEGCPGVHFELALNIEPQLELGSKIGSSEAFRDQFNVTVTEKHVYEPTIRRRCLRGLFMESSDSDNNGDNPSKPQRHGCRFCCGLKDKEKSVP